MKDEIVLFFHGFGSSDNTNKFTCIEGNKVCFNVDYSKDDISKVFEFYDTKVKSLMNEYKKVVLAGHSFGGYFANYFANKYGLKALLINPCMRPSHYVKGRVPGVENIDITVGTDKAKEVIVLAERDDEILDLPSDLASLIDLPNYDIQFFDGGHHRTCRGGFINLSLDTLLDRPFGF